MGRTDRLPERGVSEYSLLANTTSVYAGSSTEPFWRFLRCSSGVRHSNHCGTNLNHDPNGGKGSTRKYLAVISGFVKQSSCTRLHVSALVVLLLWLQTRNRRARIILLVPPRSAATLSPLAHSIPSRVKIVQRWTLVSFQVVHWDCCTARVSLLYLNHFIDCEDSLRSVFLYLLYVLLDDFPQRFRNSKQNPRY